MKKKYKVGDRVVYRPSFGTGPKTRARIIGLGLKNSRSVYDFDNGHWAYEEAIQGKISECHLTLIHCETLGIRILRSNIRKAKKLAIQTEKWKELA